MTLIPDFERVAHNLLANATTKLIALREQMDWQRELPLRCPPVLWFGNTLSNKPKLLTIAANPSRQEYLRDSSERAVQKVQQTNDDSLLTYLEPPANRFRLLSHNEQLVDILNREQLRTEIIASYNSYFSHHPYHWFGSFGPKPYKVEGFLRGLGASYFDNQIASFTSIHIDLFPFATLQDFSKIQHLANRDLFAQGWPQQLIKELVHLLQPQAVLVFGRTNFFYFTNYVAPLLRKVAWRRYDNAAFTICATSPFAVPIIGLSTNLGNPRGFNHLSLGKFGAFVGQEAQLHP